MTQRQTALDVTDEDSIQTTLEDGTLEQLSAQDRRDLAHKRLRERYHPTDGWHLFEEVGAAGENRRVDAVAVSAWPSRGYEVVGFEVTASRSDWLSELDDPGKSKWWMERCDRWYLVAPTHVANKDELPKNWGWLRLNNGGQLRKVVQAPELEPGVDRKLVGVLARQLDDAWGDRPAEKAIQNAYEEGHEDGYRRGKRDHSDRRTQRMAEKVEEYEEAIDTFQDFTGIRLRGWNTQENAEEAGRLVQALQQMDDTEQEVMRKLTYTRDQFLEQVESLMEMMEELPGDPPELDDEDLNLLELGMR